MVDLQQYMSGSFRNIMTKAYKNVLKNPRQAKFAFKMQRVFEKSEKRRKKIEVKDFWGEKNDNMIPVLSLEGAAHVTDVRRGKGVYKKVMHAMEELHQENLFFGTSITVTTENFAQVTSDAFVDHLKELGCKMIIYVEYVPTEAGTEHLAFGEGDIARMEAVQNHQRERFDDMIIISFPGDEKHMGGCLAAGRGFFHIGPDGAAETWFGGKLRVRLVTYPDTEVLCSREKAAALKTWLGR